MHTEKTTPLLLVFFLYPALDSICYTTNMTANIHRLLALQKLLADFSQVERSVHRKHNNTYIAENDTEHSYNLAMTAWYVSQQFPELDTALVLQYALAHDLVEVYAGDTYIYGSEQDLASKQQREADALQRIESEWPDFQDMTATIHAYEQRADAESKFVYALDKIMPILLIYIHDGYTWKQEGITAEMLHEAKVDKVNLSPEIVPYFNELHDLLLASPEIIQAR